MYRKTMSTRFILLRDDSLVLLTKTYTFLELLAKYVRYDKIDNRSDNICFVIINVVNVN